MLNEINFGYLPCSLEIDADLLTIRNLPNVEAISNNQRWIYPPCSGYTEKPKRVFALPHTHKIKFKKPVCEKEADFHFWVLSFLLGMRLSTESLLYLDAAPIKKGLLVDFYADDREITKALNLVSPLFKEYGEKAASLNSAVNALFLSHTPQYLEYEQFSYLYMSIDACYALHKETTTERFCTQDVKDISHAQRIPYLRKKLGLAKLPFHSRILSKLRNDLFHEAKYFNNLLGLELSHDSDEYPQPFLLQLQNLVNRFIMSSLLGPDCEYIKTQINTRNPHGLIIKQ